MEHYFAKVTISPCNSLTGIRLMTELFSSGFGSFADHPGDSPDEEVIYGYLKCPKTTKIQDSIYKLVDVIREKLPKVTVTVRWGLLKNVLVREFLSEITVYPKEAASGVRS